jgi:hypothetical protein
VGPCNGGVCGIIVHPPQADGGTIPFPGIIIKPPNG